ncbi:MAG: shikimate dehydrogenase [Bacteroidales bacterium]|nr:shikimate dehydrogenase [Bacteroidales bacterium]
MRIFGLIGYPLGHSYSKQYFDRKYLAENITDCRFENFPLNDISLMNDLIINNPDCAGFNVTIPYKSRIMEYLDWIEPGAREIGSVNCIKVERQGGQTIRKGFNTDMPAFRETLRMFVPEAGISGALVLGSGGAAKSVCQALRETGIEPVIISRSAGMGQLTYHSLSSEIIKKNRLIINTTPLGMWPETEASPPIPYHLITSHHIFYDLIYNPETTTFLKKGAEAGAKIISGLHMFHIQAELSWKIWNSGL